MFSNRFLLALFFLLKWANAFTPDVAHDRAASIMLDDKTHTSITQDGIKLAVRQYFLEKNASAPPTPERQSLLLNLNLLQLADLTIDINLPDVFSIYYGLQCALDLTPYQQAVTDVVNQNVDTDNNKATSMRADFHMDAERFVESNANIIDRLQKAKEAMSAGLVLDARKYLGTALHTTQDFYAHSNWVEMGNKFPNLGLGNNNGFFNDQGNLVPIADANTPTCRSCLLPIGTLLPNVKCDDNLLVTDKLTSGYFASSYSLPPGELETLADGSTVQKPKDVDKCSHGGLQIDLSIWQKPYGGINKDTGDPTASPHGPKWHQEAARVAVLSTAAIVTQLRHDIGDDQFELFLALGQPQCDSLLSGRRRRSLDDGQPKPLQKITVHSMEDKSPFMRARVIHDQFSSRHPVVIASAVADFSEDPMLIPVDSTVEDIVIKIAQGADTKNEITEKISLTSPSEQIRIFDVTLKNGLVTYVQVEAPEAGQWLLRVAGTQNEGPYTVTALGISTWDVIVNVMILEKSGRHVSRPTMRPVKADEILKSGSTLFVYVMAPVEKANVAQLELRGIDGSLIKNIPLTTKATVEDGFSRNLFEVSIPQDKFRFVVRGKDETGKDITRATETIYEPIKNDEVSAEDNSLIASDQKPKKIAKAKIAATPDETPSVIYVDRNVAMNTIALTAFIVFLWLMAIAAIILLKIAYDRCRNGKQKRLSEYAGDA